MHNSQETVYPLYYVIMKKESSTQFSSKSSDEILGIVRLDSDVDGKRRRRGIYKHSCDWIRRWTSAYHISFATVKDFDKNE